MALLWYELFALATVSLFIGLWAGMAMRRYLGCGEDLGRSAGSAGADGGSADDISADDISDNSDNSSDEGLEV